MRTVSAGGVVFGNAHPLALIAGPCVIESASHAGEMAHAIRDVAARCRVPFVFKASYDKANRTSLASFRGPGLARGLDILAAVKERVGCPILTDIHEPDQAAPAAEVADVLQIPAFLSRQTDLIVSAAATGRAVNLKKGQFLAPLDMRHAIAKVTASGNDRVLVTERGATFGYHNLVVDMRAFPQLRSLGWPVVYDVTHSLQLPGGGDGVTAGQSSSSNRWPRLASGRASTGCSSKCTITRAPRGAMARTRCPSRGSSRCCSGSPRSTVSCGKPSRRPTRPPARQRRLRLATDDDPEDERRPGNGLDLARRVLRIEAEAVRSLADRLDGRFDEAVSLLAAGAGRVIVTGIGKSGIIARKLAATLSSTGTSAYFIHPAEALHGDLGAIQASDVLVALSQSGETPELLRLLEITRRIGARLVALTGAPESALGQAADVTLDCGVPERGVSLQPGADGEHHRGAGPRRCACHGAAGAEGLPGGGLRAPASGGTARQAAASRR